MSRLINDFGHGVGQDRGANGIISEESVIDAVGPLVSQGLRAKGNTVLEVRPSSVSSVDDSMRQRVNASDAFGADLFVSIHANASNGQGHGVEVFTMNGKQHDEAVRVLNNLVALGIKGNELTNRGIKDGSHLAVINGPNAKAMLIEICFIDNANDVALYRRVGAQAIADAIVSGILGISVATPSAPIAKPNVTYSAHVQDIGWQETKRNGETAGTVGKAKRMEGLTIDYNGPGHLEFQCHCQNIGWQSSRQGGEIGGTSGKSLRIEAVTISLKDAGNNKIMYRVHEENIGWTGWFPDGQIAGTIGKGLRLEAIEIKIV